jgi:catechol 2,3-dioxygenase-like lactoylglutathione lyase family enzyme
LGDARLFHVNVNCSDLTRSRAFYEALGLTAATRTRPDETQPGDAFGLAHARWDAWILLGSSGFEGGAIDLLEWQEPPPAGQPPSSIVQCGYQRVGLNVTDIDAAVAAVESQGGAVWHTTTHDLGGGRGIRIGMVTDPDGVAVELVESAGTGLSFVAVACRDLDASLAFYTSLGFREAARFTSESEDGAHLHIDGPVAMDEVLVAPPGGGAVNVILVGFRTPAPVVAPPRPANTLGMWRAAYLVGDLNGACAHLEQAGVRTISEPVKMAMGPGLPELRFVCFPGPDGEVLELIEQP